VVTLQDWPLTDVRDGQYIVTTDNALHDDEVIQYLSVVQAITPRIPFVLCGYGNELLTGEDGVDYRGYLTSQQAMVDVLAGALCLFSPRTFSERPTTHLEAMAMGVPVVTMAWVSEYIWELVNGKEYCLVRSATEAVQALRRLLDDPRRRRRMGMTGYRHILRHYAPQALVPAWQEWLQWITQKR
jgi:glycosyltransferase involved in cell wall biosynthesis